MTSRRRTERPQITQNQLLSVPVIPEAGEKKHMMLVCVNLKHICLCNCLRARSHVHKGADKRCCLAQDLLTLNPNNV